MKMLHRLIPPVQRCEFTVGSHLRRNAFSGHLRLSSLVAPSSSSLPAQDQTVAPFPIRTKDDDTSESPFLSFYSIFKAKSSLASSIQKVKHHLHYPTYDFPNAFLSDAKVIVGSTFMALSSPNLCRDPEALLPLMTRSLAYHVSCSQRNLDQSGGQHLALSVNGLSAATNDSDTTKDNVLTPEKLSSDLTVSIDRISLVYGPWPVPEGYVAQEWLGYLTLVIPKEDAEFHDMKTHASIVEEAQKEGIFIKIATLVDGDFQFRFLQDSPSDSSDTHQVSSFSRSRIPVEFVSPIFSPTDELFQINEDGTWKLGFSWRISDLDACLSRPTQESSK